MKCFERGFRDKVEEPPMNSPDKFDSESEGENKERDGISIEYFFCRSLLFF